VISLANYNRRRIAGHEKSNTRDYGDFTGTFDGFYGQHPRQYYATVACWKRPYLSCPAAGQNDYEDIPGRLRTIFFIFAGGYSPPEG